MFSIVILSAVFLLIAIRQIGNVRFEIWQIMLLGAIAVVFTGQILPFSALKAIDLDVMFFLLGMFVIGQALEKSGYLAHVTYQYFKKAKSVDSLVLMILFGMGIASAFLMNDTLAIIGTPVILLLSKKHKIHPQLLLLALAFAVTIGSVMSPMGNPQNLLIAIKGNMENPIGHFLKILLLPTLINLFLVYPVLKLMYKDHFKNGNLVHSQEPIRDHNLAFLCRISLSLILVLIVLKIFVAIYDPEYDFKLTYIALISVIPILIGSPKRWEIFKKIDWHTLIFFAAMFILMESVWEAGFFQDIMKKLGLTMHSVPMILGGSVLLSQLISNVPLVALYLPIMMHNGVNEKGLLALAAGSTIAGNLLILGAASNIIIIQNAEKKAGETIKFSEFAKSGVLITLINLFVYGWFLL